MNKVYESKFQFLTDFTDEELDALATRISEIKENRFKALWNNRFEGVLIAIQELIQDCNAYFDTAITVDAGNFHEVEYTWSDLLKALEEDRIRD